MDSYLILAVVIQVVEYSSAWVDVIAEGTQLHFTMQVLLLLGVRNKNNWVVGLLKCRF